MIIIGSVEYGNKIGTDLGYPTANIGVDDDVPDGVWASMVEVEGVKYGAMVSIGRRETIIKEGSKVLEAHLFNFTGNLYGSKIKVELLVKIREQHKFNSIEELKQAIKQDETTIKNILAINN